MSLPPTKRSSLHPRYPSTRLPERPSLQSIQATVDVVPQTTPTKASVKGKNPASSGPPSASSCSGPKVQAIRPKATERMLTGHKPTTASESSASGSGTHYEKTPATIHRHRAADSSNRETTTEDGNFDSLQELLERAGYKETRIVTPKARKSAEADQTSAKLSTNATMVSTAPSTSPVWSWLGSFDTDRTILGSGWFQAADSIEKAKEAAEALMPRKTLRRMKTSIGSRDIEIAETRQASALPSIVLTCEAASNDHLEKAATEESPGTIRPPMRRRRSKNDLWQASVALRSTSERESAFTLAGNASKSARFVAAVGISSISTMTTVLSKQQEAAEMPTGDPALLSAIAAKPVVSSAIAYAPRNMACFRPANLRKASSVEVLRAALQGQSVPQSPTAAGMTPSSSTSSVSTARTAAPVLTLTSPTATRSPREIDLKTDDFGEESGSLMAAARIRKARSRARRKLQRPVVTRPAPLVARDDPFAPTQDTATQFQPPRPPITPPKLRKSKMLPAESPTQIVANNKRVAAHTQAR